MIVDIHSHVWKYPTHFSGDFRAQARKSRGGVEVDLTVDMDGYASTAPGNEPVVTIVFGGKARLSGLWVDDQCVADYAAHYRDRVLGFLSVDPTQSGWEDELRRGHRELGLVGVKLLPMYAGFFPQDERLDSLWEYVSEHGLPVLLHTGTTFVSQAPLECTLPRHLDAVAIRYPHAKIIMAHLGHPYEGECIAVMRKHPNVYADISALHYRPFQFFHSLMLVQEYGVWHKLLFGTDYPFTNVNATLATLERFKTLSGPDAAMRLSSEAIDQMIRRDSLAVLGMPRPAVAEESR